MVTLDRANGKTVFVRNIDPAAGHFWGGTDSAPAVRTDRFMSRDPVA
jgi:hypothetical protein